MRPTHPLREVHLHSEDTNILWTLVLVESGGVGSGGGGSGWDRHGDSEVDNDDDEKSENEEERENGGGRNVMNPGRRRAK